MRPLTRNRPRRQERGATRREERNNLGSKQKGVANKDTAQSQVETDTRTTTHPTGTPSHPAREDGIGAASRDVARRDQGAAAQDGANMVQARMATGHRTWTTGL